jgi:hypothetical protein
LYPHGAVGGDDARARVAAIADDEIDSSLTAIENLVYVVAVRDFVVFYGLERFIKEAHVSGRPPLLRAKIPNPQKYLY